MADQQKKPTGPIGSIFLLLADKTDGKKTWAGALMVIGGILTMIFTPDYKEEGVSLIASGIPILLVGITHKVVKNQS